MPKAVNGKRAKSSARDGSSPPGRKKIEDALRALLKRKYFSAITTAEIAKTAGVTEALIYKYFKDKRDLLHEVLAGHLEYYITRAEKELLAIEGPLNRLRKIIWMHIHVYTTDRVFAKILLLEARNYSKYFKSRPYRLVKRYSEALQRVLEEGIEKGEIRTGLSPSFIKQVILGSIEHVCLTGVVFDREISADDLTENLCEIIYKGILCPDSGIIRDNK
ncbi:MAG TPA: TetR/AcrR family transcriptional regulator [Spirochaetota bacterium]|nr:TetR/AcrR family transcriptional regulator [Spirochaetota bacterium]OPZ38657.1 MAG: Fatty acid metabolism regulator protein [Spirochaetes bacterium ADurb.BinA120]HNU90685.1 TetR/AcrR family transcriptional regulator [Spirochaetota bacterium]HPI13111.1 TetR/AcrR family transcriptional regulator [Spirochaetota bacterium]HPO46249.1 TetR/AcrR family transcriptional regulator [Spirochaetota bacterium]